MDEKEIKKETSKETPPPKEKGEEVSPKETTLQKEFLDCKNELAEQKDKYLRLLAEGENMRKRLQKEKEESLQFAMEAVISEFLPAIDSLEKALQFAEKSSEEVRHWATGFEMIVDQFREILHQYGVIAFHSTGTLFNPHDHEVMEISETLEQPEGTILEEFSKGYLCKGRTIRPARVKIAKKPSIPKG